VEKLMAFPATFQDMQNNVIDKARLDSSQDLSRVKDWLNSAYYTAVIETGFYQNSSASTSPLAANATNMLVPATIVKVEFIVPTGSDGVVWGPMVMVPIQELLRQRMARRSGQLGCAVAVFVPELWRTDDRVLAERERRRDADVLRVGDATSPVS